MSFVKSLEAIEQRRKASETADFGQAEMVNIFWETKTEIVKRVLPPPLKPAKRPVAHAFIANYPTTNFGLPYTETALFLRVEFKGEEGNYCLAMHLDGSGKDMAMAAGREFLGFPKKLSTIFFNRDGKQFEGWSERHGTRTIEVKANFGGKFNDPETGKILVDVGLIPSKLKNPAAATFNFKFFPAPEGIGYDYRPRLVKQVTNFRPNKMEIGETVKFVLKSSNHDPWGEIEVVRPLGAIYQFGNNSMQRGEVVSEVDADVFAPYSFLKWDW